VASWYDRSGNSRHPQNTQLSGGTLIPDYSETGRATILTGSSVTLGSNSVGTALQGAWCAYLVFAQPATSGTFTAAFSVGSASDSNYAYLSLRRTDLGSTRNRFGWPGGGTGYLDDTQDVGGGLVIYAVGYDGTNWKYRANGGSWTSVAGDAFSTADRIGVAYLYRPSSGFYATGYAGELAVLNRWPKDSEHAAILADLQAHWFAPTALRDRAICYLRGTGGSGAVRYAEIGAGSRGYGLAAPYGSIGSGSVGSNHSAPSMVFAGGTEVAKIGRNVFGALNYQYNFSFSFRFKCTTLPASNDAHLIGQWGSNGRTWRVRLTTAGAVAFDVATASSGGSVVTASDSVGVSTGTEYTVCCQVDLGSDLIRIKVNSRTEVTASLSGSVVYRNTDDSNTNGPITVGNGWSGSGSNYYDRPFVGTIGQIYSARGTLSSTDISYLTATNGYDLVSLPGPSVTITEPKGWVVQRNTGTNLATLTVRGSYRGNPAGFEYSVDGKPWTSSGVTPTGQTFEFTISGVGVGLHSLAVRWTGRPDVVDACQVGVGDVFVLAGQSNMCGSFTNPQKHDGPPGFAVFSDQSWITRPMSEQSLCRNGYQSCVDLTSDGIGYSVWPRVAAKLTAASGVPIGIIMAARSGTDSQSWAPDATPLNPDTLFGAMARHALYKGGCRAVLWHQGENDAAFFVSESQYTTRLNAVIDGVYTNLGVQTVVALLQLGSGGTTSQIQSAQYAIATGGNSHALLGPDFRTLQPTPNAVHFTTDTEADTLTSLWSTNLIGLFYP
jgi:hypothetical protein